MRDSSKHSFRTSRLFLRPVNTKCASTCVLLIHVPLQTKQGKPGQFIKVNHWCESQLRYLPYACSSEGEPPVSLHLQCGTLTKKCLQRGLQACPRGLTQPRRLEPDTAERVGDPHSRAAACRFIAMRHPQSCDCHCNRDVVSALCHYIFSAPLCFTVLCFRIYHSLNKCVGIHVPHVY